MTRPAEAVSRATAGLFAILVVLTALAPLSIDIYTPALPQMQADLGGADWLAQASITGCLLGIAIGQLVCGPVSDRMGRRPVILIGVIGWTLASAISALATTPAMLVAVRVVVGVCGAAGIVVARSVIRDISARAQVAGRIGTLSMVTAIAPVIAPVLGAGIAAVGGWRADFLALATIGVVLSCVCIWRLQETLPPASRVADRQVVRSLRAGLADAELGWVSAAMFAFGVGFYAYVATTSFIVERELGHPPAVFALVFGTNAVAMFLANLVFRRVVRGRHPADPLLVGLCLCLAGGCLGLWGAAAGLGGGMLWVASMIFALGAGLVLPATHGWGQSVAITSGAASALTGAAQFFGGALGSPLTGLIGLSAANLAMVVGVASACALGCWWFADRARRARAAVVRG